MIKGGLAPPKGAKVSNYQNGNIDKALTGKRKNPLVDDIVDKPSLALYLDCHEETIRNYQKDFGLPFIKIGSNTYFSIKSVYKWLMQNERTLLPEKELKKEAKGKTSKGGNKVEI